MPPTPQGSLDRAAPMAAAPFVWRADGRPDWGSMWTSFCDLALHGGPPHRGVEQTLRGPGADGADPASDPAIVDEIRRGILETTGLVAESDAPGWIAVTCGSRAMADWLATAIVLENVEVRVEGDRLLLPSGPRFRLEDEVKSIITVLAKTHHYWTMHLGAGRPPGPVKVAVGGSGDTRALIDALGRRYGRRRAVVASPTQAIGVNDHAVDLVLVEVGADGTAPGFRPEMVDASIAVGPTGQAQLALSRLEEDTRGRAVVVDVTTVEGIDVIVSWLARELQLMPWRERRVAR